jgi:hypothetical protein
MKDDYDPSLWRDDLDDEDEELSVLSTMSEHDADLLRRSGFVGTGEYDVRAIAAEVCDLWEDDEVDDDAMSNLIVRLRKAIT